jgi:glycerophosphoryl diester phosphodiesterase
MLATGFFGEGARAATTCHPSLIVHRAASAAYDEESVAGIRLGARWGWGSELDARVTADGNVVMVHDRRLSRISGHTSDLKPEESTLAELRAVTLAKGGHVITVRQAIHAAKVSHSQLMIEVKDYPTYRQQ